MKQKLIIFFLLFVILYPVGAAYKDLRNYYRDSSAYDITFYKFDLSFYNTNTNIGGSVLIRSRSLQNQLNHFFIELSQNLQIDSIIQNNQKLKYKHQEGIVKIFFDKTVVFNEWFDLKIYYHGISTSDNFLGGTSSKIDSRFDMPVTFTLSEPYNSSDWFPSKQILDDKIDSFFVSITVSPNLKAISNGKLVSVESLDDGKSKYNWECRYPTAYYLISVTVSEYQEYSFYVPVHNGKDSLLVQNFVYAVPGCLEEFKDEIDQIKLLIPFYESILGPYPYLTEKYGHVMAPMGGGMENITISTVSNFSFSLIAHELAHQWYGNMVTCKEWQDIWVNEGLASYLEYYAIEQIKGKEEANKWLTNANELAKGDKYASVAINENETTNELRLFSYALTYKKGALVLHNLRQELNNDSVFLGIIRDFLSLNQFSNSTVSDFIQFFSSKTGNWVKLFFDQWFYGQGYPIYDIFWKSEQDQLVIESTQIGSSPQTPFFEGHIELIAETKSGEKFNYRLKQKKNFETFEIPIQQKISKVYLNNDYSYLKNTTITNNITNKKFNIVPNPSRDQITIIFSKSSKNRHIRILNQEAKTEWEITTGDKEIKVSIDHLNEGTYLIVVYEDKQKYSQRFVKLK